MPAATTPPSKLPRSARSINRKKVQELAARGVSANDIAKHQGVAPSTVWRFLERLNEEKRHLETFKVNRGDVFANLQGKALGLQEKLLDHLLEDGVLSAMEDKAKVSLVNSINNVMGTAFDKERLERGQSTSNVSLIGRMMGSALTDSHRPTTSSVPERPRADEKSDS